MTINDVKVNSLLCYIIIIYVLLLSGAVTYINYKVNVVTDIQSNALSMFKKYVEDDIRQKEDIEKINKKVDKLQLDLINLDKTVNGKLTSILLLLGKDGRAVIR